jgi:hypothetical protein
MLEAILSYYRSDIAQEYEARGWYTLAQGAARALSKEHGVTLHRAAGVIAALSPMNTWAVNLMLAGRVLAAASRGRRRRPARCGLRANVDKAWLIAQGARPLDVLSGPKVRSFYRNMTGDLDAVTIDRWAARAAGLPDHYASSQSRYDEVSAAYREAAKTVGLSPAVFQAIIWCSIRGGGLTRSNGVVVRGRGHQE